MPSEVPADDIENNERNKIAIQLHINKTRILFLRPDATAFANPRCQNQWTRLPLPPRGSPTHGDATWGPLGVSGGCNKRQDDSGKEYDRTDVQHSGRYASNDRCEILRVGLQSMHIAGAKT